jgi:flagellar motor switch protein FliN/FliY
MTAETTVRDPEAAVADAPAAESAAPREAADQEPSMDLLLDVDLQLTIELGRTVLPLGEVLRLGPGSVVKLAKQVGEPVDVLANGKLIARGELVVLDSALAVRITDVVDGRDSHG